MKSEIRRAFSNWGFVITLIILCLISSASAISTIHIDIVNTPSNSAGTNPFLGVRTLYNRWIAMVWDDPYSTIFFTILPLAAAIPSGASLYNDRRTGYIAQMVIRKRRLKYLSERFLATFISGGTVVTISVIVNICITALHFPVRKPDLYFDIYTSVQPFSFASTLFYTTPFIHMILRILVIFLYAGAAAVMCLATTCFSRNRYVILFSPMMIFLFLNFAYNVVHIPYELSPLRFLGAHNAQIMWAPIVWGEFFIFVCITTLLLWIWGRKKDVL